MVVRAHRVAHRNDRAEGSEASQHLEQSSPSLGPVLLLDIAGLTPQAMTGCLGVSRVPHMKERRIRGPESTVGLISFMYTISSRQPSCRQQTKTNGLSLEHLWEPLLSSLAEPTLL